MTAGDASTILLVPTRGRIHPTTVEAIAALQPLPGQKRSLLFASGHEVGLAYDAMIQQVLDDPELSRWAYLLTLEDDNLPPPNAHELLLQSLLWGDYDAVSGIYFTKGPVGMPMAYGDPAEFAATGVLDFKPRDVRQALAEGTVMPVNGIAMGCALWKLSMFRELPKPWFVTMADVVPGLGARCFTQDLHFCERAIRDKKKKFAVDFRVKVGHLDVTTGVTY